MSGRFSENVNKATSNRNYKILDKNKKDSNEMDEYQFISNFKKVFIDYKNFLEHKDLSHKSGLFKKNILTYLKKN
jgi:hypothetical protein